MNANQVTDQEYLLNIKDYELARQHTEFFISEVAKKQRPLFAFGRNVYSKGLISSVELAGVVDEFTAEKSWFGLPIVSLTSLPDNALIIVCARDLTQTVLTRVRSMGFETIDYYAFFLYSTAQNLPQIDFNEGFAQDFQMNEPKYYDIYRRLDDDDSKNIYRRLVSFRLHHYIEMLQGFENKRKHQYFEDFLNLQNSGEVFVDVGCFDGETSLEFSKRCPKYKKILAIEPEPSNFKRCRQNLSSLTNVEVYPLGLSSKNCDMRITNNGSTSSISAEGDSIVQLRKLDDILNGDEATLVKVDTEGAEMDVIEGGAETIKKWHPRLAISVYHKPGDFWKIPQRILALNPNYKMYLRHYTETIYETVMFFVP